MTGLKQAVVGFGFLLISICGSAFAQDYASCVQQALNNEVTCYASADDIKSDCINTAINNNDTCTQNANDAYYQCGEFVIEFECPGNLLIPSDIDECDEQCRYQLDDADQACNDQENQATDSCQSNNDQLKQGCSDAYDSTVQDDCDPLPH